MNYTKGDWKAYKDPTNMWVVATEDAKVACEMRHFDAYLIAAAPEMYEALQMAREVMEISEVVYAMEGQVGKEPYLRILKAIAKAGGK